MGFSKQLDRFVNIEKEFVKPLLKGEDVHRYDKIKTDRVVIFPYKITDGSAGLYKEDEIKSKFPMAYSYLKECEDILRDREKGRLKNDTFWYRYIYPKNLTLFANEKLVAPEISLGGNFSLDKNGEFYSTTKIYGYIKNDKATESYRFWLGLLNSRLFWFFIQQTGYILRGGYYTFKTNYVHPFPIPKEIPLHIAKSIEEIVDEILLSKEKHPSNDISLYGNKIDIIVYDLYGFSDEEIKLINEQARY